MIRFDSQGKLAVILALIMGTLFGMLLQKPQTSPLQISSSLPHSHSSPPPLSSEYNHCQFAQNTSSIYFCANVTTNFSSKWVRNN